MHFLLFFTVLVITTKLTYSCRTKADLATIVADLKARFTDGRADSDGTKQDYVPGTLRLAFHDAGTWDSGDNSGGPNGCVPLEDADNAGLKRVIDLIEPAFQAHKAICPSRADFWALAAAVGVNVALKGDIAVANLVEDFEWGRDFEQTCTNKIGRLPSHQLGLDHIKAVFQQRMGFTDREIVALMGAHTIGRGHKQFSGFDFTWDQTSMTFDNTFYKGIMGPERTWSRGHPADNPDIRFWVNPNPGFQNQFTGDDNMMLNTDMALAWDFGTNKKDTPIDSAHSCHILWPLQLRQFLRNVTWIGITPDINPPDKEFCPELQTGGTRQVVQEYAQNEDQFQKDFAKAYKKLMGLGYGSGSTRGELCKPCDVGDESCCCRGKCVVDPTTEAPTTEAPTTEAPTTEAPTTEAPTTEDPTTEDPTTEDPTSEDPTTEDPTTEDPTTEDPTSEDPTTEDPTAEDPTTEDPTTEEPTSEDPTTEDPTSEDPTTEDPYTAPPTKKPKRCRGRKYIRTMKKFGN